jgi:hypothetical protein
MANNRKIQKLRALRPTRIAGRRRKAGVYRMGCPLPYSCRCRCLYRSDHPIRLSAQDRPLLITENDESDSPASQVLLISDVLVGGQQDLETSRFGGRDELAVYKPVPSRSIASTTTWSFRKWRSGAGVPLSKSMSIWRGSTARICGDYWDRRLHVGLSTGGGVETPRSELEDGAYLVPR